MKGKFKLELPEAEAERFLHELIGDCTTAVWPEMLEFAHRLATAIK